MEEVALPPTGRKGSTAGVLGEHSEHTSAIACFTVHVYYSVPSHALQCKYTTQCYCMPSCASIIACFTVQEYTFELRVENYQSLVHVATYQEGHFTTKLSELEVSSRDIPTLLDPADWKQHVDPYTVLCNAAYEL